MKAFWRFIRSWVCHNHKLYYTYVIMCAFGVYNFWSYTLITYYRNKNYEVSRKCDWGHVCRHSGLGFSFCYNCTLLTKQWYAPYLWTFLINFFVFWQRSLEYAQIQEKEWEKNKPPEDDDDDDEEEEEWALRRQPQWWVVPPDCFVTNELCPLLSVTVCIDFQVFCRLSAPLNQGK